MSTADISLPALVALFTPGPAPDGIPLPPGDTAYFLSPGACQHHYPGHNLRRTLVPRHAIRYLNTETLAVVLGPQIAVTIHPWSPHEHPLIRAALETVERLQPHREFAFRSDMHGPAHWVRVAHWGLLLAEAAGADPHTVLAFAVLHDLFRETDDDDPEHGPRAAEFVDTLEGRDLLAALGLPWQAVSTLRVALRHHSYGRTAIHPDVACCWDADRYDLTRGPRPHVPSPRLFSTKIAKDRLWTL